MSMDVGGGKNVNSDINVTPFCDVVLVLLIIFMVITPMLQKGVPVVLPNARNPQVQPDADKESSLVITIPAENDYRLTKEKLPFEALREQIGDDYQRNPAKPVFIKADRTLPFYEVKRVLKAVQDVGFKKVALLSQHVDEKGNIITGTAASNMSQSQ
jgi:biopolymer transport protein TolR